MANFKNIKRTMLLLLLCSNTFVISAQNKKALPKGVLYNKVLNNKTANPELITAAGNQYTDFGLSITAPNSLVRLNKYYSLAERLIRYHVRFSGDAVGVFQTDQGDLKAYVDIPNKKIYLGTNPVTEKKVEFLDATHEYAVEIHRNYQQSKLRITDLKTGKSSEIAGTMDGGGGVGAGSVGPGFFVGLQHDYYCFGLNSGSSIRVKQICVMAKETNLTLLLYGDSITEPEGYFPTADFPKSWTQLIMKNIKGKSMASGRGGTTIVQVLDRIKNELPFVKAKYVMVTIGTNGGNTEENLSELVEYIKAQGSIPVLNNIPSNESGSQVAVNDVIEKIRQKYNIKGTRFDVATSVDQGGKKVDNTTMYFEDYDWGKIYHHPNVKGSHQMYSQTLIDVPEIYK
ncbi:SGNH/GDSL hydrolase family protein [Pedobacter psychroterrae]|uniref:SGNH/GDSL hydrolase family protein n=1 Tax=Pedobacter psychroterrae TaxID=2530453 RepID=UPI00197DA2DF|nr:SGNH/GDSL hydrolase family protein [Pedobacter psychroterrae]